jgi:hypothetical protein
VISRADERFRREAEAYKLRCTCDFCVAFDAGAEACAYGYPTAPHRRLPVVDGGFAFCKAFEVA